VLYLALLPQAAELFIAKFLAHQSSQRLAHCDPAVVSLSLARIKVIAGISTKVLFIFPTLQDRYP